MLFNLNIEQLEEKYKELENTLSKKEIISNSKEREKVGKEYNRIGKLINNYKQLLQVKKDIDETKKIEDENLKELVQEEIIKLENKQKGLENEIKLSLLPPCWQDERNIIMEIRAGTGGDEAGIFVGDLFRMYSKYAESKGWKIEIISSNVAGIGGFKEIIFIVEGKKVFSTLKYEQGVHRVQRVPLTEASGRIHTSTVTVAVLPEAEDVEIDINPKDLKIDVFRAGSAGGQNVNKVETAIRITHFPTGIVAQCQDERSQQQNRIKAMRVLKARILEMKQQEELEKRTQERKSQIGAGERSEKIRTYNFPQNRVTDHRIGVSLYKLTRVMEGDLKELIDLLIEDEQNKLLKNIL